MACKLTIPRKVSENEVKQEFRCLIYIKYEIRLHLHQFR